MRITKQLTKNFHRSEFDCKDGTQVPEGYRRNLIQLATNLQVVRDDIDSSVHINSGYRTPSHNKKEGGGKGSYHLTAEAGDLRQSKETPLQFYNRIEGLINEGKMEDGGLGLYDNFIHYDVRGHKARWNESKYKI